MKRMDTLLASVLFAVGIASGQTTYYTNVATGDNSWDGLSPTHTGGTNGPKATLQAIIDAASPGDILDVGWGVYDEVATFTKNLSMVGTYGASIGLIRLENDAKLNLPPNPYGNNFHVYGTLHLESGILETCANKICICSNQPDAVVIGAGSVVGQIERLIPAGATGTFLFTDPYTSFTPDPNQSAVTFSIRSYPSTIPPQSSGGNTIERYYEVSTSESITGTLALAYLVSELNGIQEGDLSMFRHTGTAWVEHGGFINTTNKYVMLASAALTSTSPWTLGDATSPLPIQLAYFGAEVVGSRNDVRVSWGTLSETNNYGFHIQSRNSELVRFEDIHGAFIPGHGTSLEPHDYQWMHLDVAPGTYEYRLRQIDLDGTEYVTEAVQVVVPHLTSISTEFTAARFALLHNYPNPFNPSTMIEFSVEEAGWTTLHVYDLLGQHIATLYDGLAERGVRYRVPYDATTLANGTYLYRLTSGQRSVTQRMMLLK